MSYLDDFNAWREQIEAVAMEELKLPHVPIDEYAASCETLAIEATKDADALVQAGLNVNVIGELSSLSGAMRYCQAEWMSEYRNRQESQKEWVEQSPSAFEFRDEMLHDFRFAFRNDKNTKAKVMRISEGNSNVDMIQDLLEIAVLGEKNPEPLTQINFDMTKLDKARTISHHLSELLANVNGSSDQSSATKILRDKAYTLLFNRDSQIREFGRYVFWKNPNRLEKYTR